MLPDRETMCHRTGFSKSCFEGVVQCKCQLWMQLNGMNPQTGEQIAKWGCADSFLPLLTIELIRKTDEVGGSVDSFRNTYQQEENINRNMLIERELTQVTALPASDLPLILKEDKDGKKD